MENDERERVVFSDAKNYRRIVIWQGLILHSDDIEVTKIY